MGIEKESIGILGTGITLPPIARSNYYFEGFLETNDAWIKTRTGIQTRFHALKNQSTLDYAHLASIKALQNAQKDWDDIDLILVATTSSEYRFPSLACRLLERANINKPIPAFDLSAACSGFTYAADTAWHYLQANPKYNHILVLGIDLMSRFLDWQDRKSCILFGDAAGASVIGRSNQESNKNPINSSKMKAQIIGSQISASQTPLETLAVKSDAYLEMNGSEVFKQAIRAMTHALKNFMKEYNISIDQIKKILPHQANSRIIKQVAKSLDISQDRMMVNINRYGNTSAASIALCWNQLFKSENIHPGDIILSVSFGAGFTIGVFGFKIV